MGMEGFNVPKRKKHDGYESVLREDGDSNFVVNEEALRNAENTDAALEVLSRDDIAQILEELEKPDLNPALKKAFKMVLKNKGVEHIDMGDRTLQ